MPFENPNQSEVLDEEKAQILKKVQRYLEESLEGLEEVGVDEGQAELQQILEAFEQEDYAPAFEYLENEIAQLKKRVTEVHDSDVPKIEVYMSDLEKLKDSLLLSEK